MEPLTETEFEAANTRGAATRRRGPRALTASYHVRTHRLVVELNTGLSISFDPRTAQGLEDGSARDFSRVEITPSGLGLHFPTLDADLYLPGLLKGLLGSRSWMAAQIGRAGGKATSAAKTDAARKNGRLGGRPRKEQEASSLA